MTGTVLRKLCFHGYHKTGQAMLWYFRLSYTYQLVHKSVVVLTSMLLVIQFRNLEIAVLSTIFYATVLLVVNIYKDQYPYVIISDKKPYFDSAYAEGDDSYGFEYEIKIVNQGSQDMNNPRIQYAVYDSDYSKIDGWTEFPGTAIQSEQISPTDDPVSFTFEKSGTVASEEVDYYLAIRVLPRRSNWIFGSWKTDTVHHQTNSSQ